MADAENINFLDLACLFKITTDTTLERFGSTINSSVFDAANISGSLKQKGLIDFTAYYPGPNSIILTDSGKKTKEDADGTSSLPADNLDDEILKQMSSGKKFPQEIQSSLNIRSRDLAFRLYKLFKQNLLGYELKNGTVELMLTEQGFLRAKAPPQTMQPPKPATQPAAQTQPAIQPQGQMQMPKMGAQTMQPGMAQEQMGPQEQVKIPKKRNMKRTVGYAAAVVAVIVIVLLFYLNII